jgi:hypothetical protein
MAANLGLPTATARLLQKTARVRSCLLRDGLINLRFVRPTPLRSLLFRCSRSLDLATGRTLQATAGIQTCDRSPPALPGTIVERNAARARQEKPVKPLNRAVRICAAMEAIRTHFDRRPLCASHCCKPDRWLWTSIARQRPTVRNGEAFVPNMECSKPKADGRLS